MIPGAGALNAYTTTTGEPVIYRPSQRFAGTCSHCGAAINKSMEVDEGYCPTRFISEAADALAPPVSPEDAS